MKEYRRSQFTITKPRQREKSKFIRVIFGPRQVGETTLITQLLKNRRSSYTYNSADSVESSGKDELQPERRGDII